RHAARAVPAEAAVPRPRGARGGAALAARHAAVQRRPDEDVRPAGRARGRHLLRRRLQLGVEHGRRCAQRRARGRAGAEGPGVSARAVASKNRAVTIPRQVLRPDGKLVDGAQPMEEEFLLEALRWMMKSRLYDHRVISLQRQGQFGVFSPGMGQEASIVGSAMAVDPARDWMVPQYRELMASVHHGLPLEVISSQYLGKIGPARIP